MLRKRVAIKKGKKTKVKKPRFIGITGGIGSGKSTLSRVLKEEGFPVFSADEIARELTSKGSPALKRVVKIFGSRSVVKGEMDRAYLREEIIKKPVLRRKLEALLHPMIQKRSLSLAKAEFKKGNSIVFYEAPLLFEAKSNRAMDAVICVAAKDRIRIARVKARDHAKESSVRALLKAQMPQRKKIALSDYVIWNNGTASELKRAAHKLLKKICI